MPAAAVITALIVYIKVVAVKKLVVEPWVWSCGPAVCRVLQERTFALLGSPWSSGSAWGTRTFYFEKIRVFKAGEVDRIY